MKEKEAKRKKGKISVKTQSQISWLLVTLQSKKKRFFLWSTIFFSLFFFFKYMPFGSMHMLFILQIFYFYFLVIVLLFALSAQFSYDFLSVAQLVQYFSTDS